MSVVVVLEHGLADAVALIVVNLALFSIKIGLLRTQLNFSVVLFLLVWLTSISTSLQLKMVSNKPKAQH